MVSPATAFETLARDFCSEVEDGPVDPRALLRRLVGLVAGALEMPVAEPTDHEYEDPRDLAAATRAVSVNLTALLGESDLYWEVFDPRDLSDPVAGSLLDDLADIYRDLRRGLHILSTGSPDDAMWEWRFSFDTHWGNHATDAIRVLHRWTSNQPRLSEG